MSTSSVEATLKNTAGDHSHPPDVVATAFWAFKTLATANRRLSVFLLITSDHHHDYTFLIFKMSNLARYDRTFLKQEVFVHLRLAIFASLLVLLSMSIGCSTKPLPSERVQTPALRIRHQAGSAKKKSPCLPGPSSRCASQIL
jgi:hypothetical protein